MSGSRSRELRDRLQKSLLKERFTDALGYYTVLESMEADEPRWPHRKGDLLKRLGRADDAVDSYERAVELYAQRGFLACASAMAKVVMAIDPSRADVLERVTPEPAWKVHRTGRRPVVTAEPNRALDPPDTTHEEHLAAEAFPLVQTKGPSEHPASAPSAPAFSLIPPARAKKPA